MISETLSIGLLIARLAIGLLMAAHGAQKLFGWFGGAGLKHFGEMMSQMGYRPAILFATAASIGEFASGLLIAAGFLGPVGPAVMLSVMVVAIVAVHWPHGLFAMQNGIEVPLLYAIASIVFAVVGYGMYSIDALIGSASPWSPVLTWSALAVGVLGGLVNSAIKRPVRREGV